MNDVTVDSAESLVRTQQEGTLSAGTSVTLMHFSLPAIYRNCSSLLDCSSTLQYASGLNTQLIEK